MGLAQRTLRTRTVVRRHVALRATGGGEIRKYKRRTAHGRLYLWISPPPCGRPEAGRGERTASLVSAISANSARDPCVLSVSHSGSDTVVDQGSAIHRFPIGDSRSGMRDWSLVIGDRLRTDQSRLHRRSVRHAIKSHEPPPVRRTAEVGLHGSTPRRITF
jgi:hypothetical protein